jgi:hypothetical protein
MTIDAKQKQYKLFSRKTEESDMATKPAAKPTAKSKPAATTTTAAKTVKPVTTTTAKPAVAKPAAAQAPASKAAVSKPAVKPAAKPAAKPLAKASAPVAKKPAAAAAAKTPAKAVVANDKPKTPKVKMERDSFTMPKDEYAQIAALKKRLEGLGKPVKKSELLRAGLKLLATLNDSALKATLDTVPTIKTGRPKK